MASITRAQIPDSALASAEALAVYAGSLAAYSAATTKRQEIVGGAAIPAYTCDPTKFPSGQTYALIRMTIPIDAEYQNAGGPLWTHALEDPDWANLEPGYKQAGT